MSDFPEAALGADFEHFVVCILVVEDDFGEMFDTAFLLPGHVDKIIDL